MWRIEQPRVQRRRLLVIAALVSAGFGAEAEVAPEAGWAALQDGTVVLLRHAQAPGVGDPAGFKIGDCATQRNLDDSGRAQARRIGAQFRSHGVKVGAVLSSQWCRTRDTAELAFPGQARDDTKFNSFFDDESTRAAQTAAALALLNRWRGPGVLVVSTHQVNITALTGVFPASGEIVVLKPAPNGTGRPAVLARFTP